MNNSVLLNNKINMIESLLGVFLIIVTSIYTISKNNLNLSQFLISPEAKQRNRSLQFLLNFGMNNVLIYLTVHGFWDVMGISFVK